jgi:hypothetical protein
VTDFSFPVKKRSTSASSRVSFIGGSARRIRRP